MAKADPLTSTASSSQATVAVDDLIALVAAARQLRSTALLTEGAYLRLGPVIDRAQEQIESLQADAPARPFQRRPRPQDP